MKMPSIIVINYHIFASTGYLLFIFSHLAYTFTQNQLAFKESDIIGLATLRT